MTQKIEPTYVTREQAKWLKEKEFDLPTYAYYSGLNFYTGEYKNHSQTTIGDTPMHKMLIGYISAPEQWQVVEWLRVNHGIWIELRMGKDSNSVWFDYDIFSTIKPRKDDELGEEGVEYEEDPNERFLNWDTTHDSLIDEKFEVFTKTSHDSPQEAYSAAFDYILNNLI
jgi:hypothetical protein